MNHKVSRSVFVLTVALGIAGVMVRIKDAPAVHPRRTPPASVDSSARPLASYRVIETPSESSVGFLGANYKAEVSERGFVIGQVPEQGSRYASREFTVEFGAPRLEQGSSVLECSHGRLVRRGHGVEQIDRGAVIEEYVLENRRAEQIFRIPEALGDEALRVCIPVKSDLGGPVVVHSPSEEGFRDLCFKKGGIAFCDILGQTKLAYHSAVVEDADGRKLALAPKYERTEIVLEVPAEFMRVASYPVVIDPWLSMGTGISSGFHSAERPAFAKRGSGSPWTGAIAWSDNSTGNFEIYVSMFSDSGTAALGSSLSPGGISNNAGLSINPSVVMNNAGEPIVAWEDSSNGNFSIYLRHWNSQQGIWEELAGSATKFGLSGNIGSNHHPSVGFMRGIIPGTVTFDPTTGLPTSTPPSFQDCPVVAWDTNGAILLSAFYPGAPAIPPPPANPAGGFAAVPAGWYGINTLNGQNVSAQFGLSATSIASGNYPSLVVDADNRPAIAFEDTSTGNYEIFMRRWTYNPPPAGGFANWQVVTAAGSTSFNTNPPGNFTDITGVPGASTNVSNTANPSQFPSMAVDGVSNLTIAWQETESAVAPTPPGTTSQILVARSVAGGAFGALGTSLSAGGISNTLAQASTPSVDADGVYVAVAWADTSNSLSSIYVRRFAIGGPGTWDQVGFQGSAFPPAFVGEVAPIAGVSQSANFAIQPQIRLDGGDPSVIWADGALGNFNILGATFVGNAPGVAVGIGTNNPTFQAQVQQSSTDPTLGPTPIPVGGFSSGTSVWLFARVFTENVNPPTTTLRLEIEIQPAGTPFTGTPNIQTLFVAPDNPANPTLGNLAVIKFDGLPNFNYHWEARTVDQQGRGSPWISPGETSGVSFRINSAVAANGGGSNGAVNTGSINNRSRGKCGLTGFEAIAFLGALGLIRRRRRAA